MRSPVTVTGRDGVVIRLGRDELVNFCSNDYLGLADHPRLIRALSRAAEQNGAGAGASPMVSGRHRIHAQLEQALAQFTGRSRALLFGSGYLANLAVLPVLAPGRGDRILMDRLCHASLIDAARLSRAALQRFAHGDGVALERLLEQDGGGMRLVVSESVYSMDGDIAPLDDYARLCAARGACLYVDDAHGFGVLGGAGRGGPEHFGLGQEQLPLVMATFGKALGVAGAFVAGPEEMIEALLQYGRPYIYDTAMPPALAGAVAEALAVLAEESWRRQHLQGLIRQFRAGLGPRGLPPSASMTPIQPLIIGASDKAVKASKQLQQKGFYVAAIRPPTVPEGSARLRITLTAGHSQAQLDGLLDALGKVLAP
jgi:8-amino-7-oxononanoate synthase